MARRHHYKRRTKDAHELDVTTFLNLMVVLVPFLLITAVFSRLTIVELNLPSSAGGATNAEEGFQPEVIVRENGIEITNGKVVIAAIPNKDEDFDLETLSDYMVELKQTYPEQDAASVLMEAQIPYDYLIQVMDIVRAVEVPIEDVIPAEDESPEDDKNADKEYELVALFSEISVGDAP
jgi:biopolymer transport protein ExbD